MPNTTNEFQAPDPSYQAKLPFYHEKCPNCGFCNRCGKTESPFANHWRPTLDPAFSYYTAETYVDFDGDLTPRT